jgi:two-component system chemotaxis response regulator CheY
MPTTLKKTSRKLKGRTHLTVGVLIVDDEQIMRALIGIVIERAGELCVVGEAPDGLEALKSLDVARPDAVVLDERMPGISGIETAGRMHERRPNMPIILCTAYLDEALRRRAQKAGVSMCVPKADFKQIPLYIWQLTAA